MTDVRDLKKGSSKNMTLEQLAEVVVSNEFYGGTEFTGIVNGDSEDVNINNRTYGSKLEWRKRYGVNRQVWIENKDMQIAEDMTYITMSQCRCCQKENVQPYTEKYFEKHFNFKTLFCFENGYCKECAEKKAGITHPVPALAKEEWVRVRSYEVGGENFTFRTDKLGNVWYWK